MCFPSIEREIGSTVGVEEMSWLLYRKNDTKAINCEYHLKFYVKKKKKKKIYTDFYAIEWMLSKANDFYTSLKCM